MKTIVSLCLIVLVMWLVGASATVQHLFQPAVGHNSITLFQIVRG